MSNNNQIKNMCRIKFLKLILSLIINILLRFRFEDLEIYLYK